MYLGMKIYSKTKHFCQLMHVDRCTLVVNDIIYQ